MFFDRSRGGLANIRQSGSNPGGRWPSPAGRPSISMTGPSRPFKGGQCRSSRKRRPPPTRPPPARSPSRTKDRSRQIPVRRRLGPMFVIEPVETGDHPLPGDNTESHCDNSLMTAARLTPPRRPGHRRGQVEAALIALMQATKARTGRIARNSPAGRSAQARLIRIHPSAYARRPGVL